MPGFDGTGPAGGGPMTGRGLGFCATGRPFRGFPVWGRWPMRRGMGYRWGGRWGWTPYPYGGMQSFTPGAASPTSAMSREEELRFLKEQADEMKEQLKYVEERMRDMERETE